VVPPPLGGTGGGRVGGTVRARRVACADGWSGPRPGGSDQLPWVRAYRRLGESISAVASPLKLKVPAMDWWWEVAGET
jgi:hypothetical protein